MNGINTIRLSDKIFFSCSDGNRAVFAYDHLLRYRQAAQIQFKRIQGATTHDEKFIDTHFYFIAWANCRNMMKAISSIPEFKQTSIYYNSNQKILDDYVEARNTFEHFNDRIPGGKQHTKVKEVTEKGANPRKILGGFEEGSYKFSNKTYDISHASLTLLEKIISGFILIIEDVIQKKH
jgi:hypothetical protein